MLVHPPRETAKKTAVNGFRPAPVVGPPELAGRLDPAPGLDPIPDALPPVVTRFKRRELKFVLDAEQRRRLTADLMTMMTPDPHGDAEGCYPVVDLYYDNRFHDLYWEHVRGIDSRLKLRLRVYGGARVGIPPLSFLEIKRKHKGRVYKQRVELPIDEALAVASGAEPRATLDRSGQKVVDLVHTLVSTRLLRPSCVLRYDRQALRGSGDDAELRITFDNRVRFRIDELVPEPDDRRCDRVILGADRSVMEVKVPEQVPGWLAALINRHGCLRQGHSKYCRSFESIFLANGTGAEARRRWEANLAG